jgi:hypothetical protein
MTLALNNHAQAASLILLTVLKLFMEPAVLQIIYPALIVGQPEAAPLLQAHQLVNVRTFAVPLLFQRNFVRQIRKFALCRYLK